MNVRTTISTGRDLNSTSELPEPERSELRRCLAAYTRLVGAVGLAMPCHPGLRALRRRSDVGAREDDTLGVILPLMTP